MAPLPPFW